MGTACDYTLILYIKGEYNPSGFLLQPTFITACNLLRTCVPTHKSVTAESFFSLCRKATMCKQYYLCATVNWGKVLSKVSWHDMQYESM